MTARPDRAMNMSHGPEQYVVVRARLLQLLRVHGILHASPSQPVLSRDGSSAKWMLDSLCVSLTPEGLELAGRCLLHLLDRFDGRQLATYGLTGTPLVSSCILQSGGRYKGSYVRKERKPYGSRKLIEGPLDPEEPVILIDDSVSSGLSATEATKHLEAAGFRVEGCICLVRFGWYGGYALMQERGYHMEAVYDIWEDFMYGMEGEEPPVPNPSKVFPPIVWSTRRLPDSIPPYEAARLVLEEYVESGQVPLPPTSLDSAYDGSGGVWVSLRSKANIHERHARDGFWHFPGEDHGPIARDLLLATLRTAACLPRGEEGRRVLDSSAIAVTFFSQLEECTVGELDNDRYGIVVRSRERPSRMGGALPRMPGILNEWHQFQHARGKNAQLVSFEPYVLYRHDLTKVVEPGVRWQPSGVPRPIGTWWYEDPSLAGRLAERALDLAHVAVCGGPYQTSPLPSDFLLPMLDTAFVSLFSDGRLIGCMGSRIRNCEEDLRVLVQSALADQRFEKPESPFPIAVRVSLLYDPLELGPVPVTDVPSFIRTGHEALMVYQGTRSGVMLPEVAVMDDLTPEAFVAEVIDKAGITRPPYRWCRWKCAAWLAGPNKEPRCTEGGFPTSPVAPVAANLPNLVDLLTSYLLRNVREDGTLFGHYSPSRDVLHPGIDIPRMAHAGWVLARAWRVLGRKEIEAAARQVLGRLRRMLIETEDGHVWVRTDAEPPSVAEISLLLLGLLALQDLDEAPKKLAQTLWASIGVHGRIATHREPLSDDDLYQDYYPGQALLALASAARAGLTEMDPEGLQRAFLYYRHRFRYKRRWGQVSWLMQAFSEWWWVTRDPEFAALVFEIGDWALTHQQSKSGGFINEHQPDTPGFMTAVYLEGIVSAIPVADATHGGERAARYSRAGGEAMRFLDRLIIQERDRAVIPNPAWAMGGVRPSLYQQEIRIDFVQHTLAAALGLMVSPPDRRGLM